MPVQIVPTSQIDEIEQTEKSVRPTSLTDKNKLSLLEDPFLHVDGMKGEIEK